MKTFLTWTALIVIWSTVVLLLVLILSSVAWGQEQQSCALVDQVLVYLETNFQETVYLVFNTPGQGSYIMTTSEAKETWSVLAVRPDGIACIVAEGVGYELIPQGEMN